MKRKNVIHMLQDREHMVKCHLRHNWKILRQLVSQKDCKFKKVWEKHANKPISCEGGCLYFDNYRTCITMSGHKGLPQLLYKLPPCRIWQKIEDCLLCTSPVASIALDHQGYRASMLALTADNLLLRYDAQNGKLLQEVYLTSKCTFRHISWDDEYQVVLKSTHSKHSDIERIAGITRSILMVLAVFTIFPLEFVGMLEINKRIFGHDVTDAMLSQGVLIVMHQGGFVRLYSWQHILKLGSFQSVKLNDKFPDGIGTVGTHPCGLPLNIVLSERPPLLFQVRCAEHMLTLGGHPWHYIMTPPGSRGHFHVCSMANKQLALNGSLDMGTLTLEPDKCIFHADDSGRILHIGAGEVRVLRIKENAADISRIPHFKITNEFNIVAQKQSLSNTYQRHQVSCTSSGRTVKRVCSFSEDMLDGDSSESIQTVDYETDLDLMVVTSVHPSGDKTIGKVQLHDNSDGRLVQQVDLLEPWREFCDHVVLMDLDTIVHVVKAPLRKFSCYVYKLQRDDIDAETEDSPRTRLTARRPRHQSASHTLSQEGRRPSQRRRRQAAESDSDSDYVA